MLLEAISKQKTAGAVAEQFAFATKSVSAIEFRMMRLRRYGAALYGTNTAKPWEDEEDRLLIEMYEKGVKHTRI